MKAAFSPPIRFMLAGLLFILLELVLIAFIDRPVSEYFRMLDARHKPLVDFFRAWTDIGKSCWYLWPSGIGALIAFAGAVWGKFPAAKRAAWRWTGQTLSFFFASVALSGIVTDLLKPLLGRARPVLLQRQGFYGFDPLSFHAAHHSFNSMPSGHATTAFAVGFVLVALQPRWRVWALAFAVAVSVSRIVVNAHYLSDTLAGAAVAILTVLILRNLFYRRGWIAVAGRKV